MKYPHPGKPINSLRSLLVQLKIRRLLLQPSILLIGLRIPLKREVVKPVRIYQDRILKERLKTFRCQFRIISRVSNQFVISLPLTSNSPISFLGSIRRLSLIDPTETVLNESALLIMIMGPLPLRDFPVVSYGWCGSSEIQAFLEKSRFLDGTLHLV